jgi:NAD(P)H-dependent flavin oxidoreductase YrpB (nitropropane dioxygenase family)
MPITTTVTQLLGITHPIMLAPMDLVADGRLVAAVAVSGAFGILGGGYGLGSPPQSTTEICSLDGAKPHNRQLHGITPPSASQMQLWPLGKHP